MRKGFGLMGRIDKVLGCTTISTRGILAIIIPLMIQMLLESVIGMADTAITSSYGSEILVANGIIGTVNTLLMNVIHAIGVGGAVLSAQYKGQGGAESVAATKRVIAQTTSLTVSVALFATFFAIFLAKPFLRFAFGSVGEEAITHAHIYLMLIAASYFLHAIGGSLLSILTGLGDSKAALLIGTSAAVVATGLTYVFVGLLGMGIYGSALALGIHRVYKTTIAFLLLKRNHPEYQFRLRDLIGWDFEILKKILTVSIPITLEFFFSNAGSIIHGMVIARLGTTAIKANALIPSFISIASIFITGFNAAISPIVGRCVGAGKPKEARRMTVVLTIASSIAYALFIACYIPFLPLVIRAYSPTPEVMEMVPLLLYSFIGAYIFVYPASELGCSALRASGDSLYTSIISLVGMWGVSVVLSYLLGIHFGLGLIGDWISTYAFWAFRAVFFMGRIFSKKWCKKKLV